MFFFQQLQFLQQSTQGAELNSEATLNCLGKEFKCVNSTHYQTCSLTERSGQQPQWTINGVILPCVAGQECSDESTINCAAARVVQPIENEVQSQIPVEVTVAQEPVVAVAVEAPVESVATPAKSLPAEEVMAEAPAAVVAPVVPIPSEEAIAETPVATPAKSLPAEDAAMVSAEKEIAAPVPEPSATEAAAVAAVSTEKGKFDSFNYSRDKISSKTKKQQLKLEKKKMQIFIEKIENCVCHHENRILSCILTFSQ